MAPSIQSKLFQWTERILLLAKLEESGFLTFGYQGSVFFFCALLREV